MTTVQLIDFAVRQYAIPLVVSLYDYWYNQRSRTREAYVPLQRFQGLPLQVAYSVCRRSLYHLTQSQFKGIVAAAFITLSGYTASSFTAGSRSTYVCPIVLYGAARLQTFKILNLLVDSALLIGVADLWRSGVENEEKRKKRTLMSLGAGLLVSGNNDEHGRMNS